MKSGDVLTNRELAKRFGVSTQSGMRRSITQNCLVLTTDPDGALYKDRWKGDILLYTGMGKIGD